MKLPSISLDQARKLKQIGFDWGVEGSYTEYLTQQVHPEDGTTGAFGWEQGEVEYSSDFFINDDRRVDYSNESYVMYACPSVPLAIKWLYHARNLYVELDRWADEASTDHQYFVFSVYDHVGERLESNDFRYPELDDAESAGLDWCLNYLMEGQK